MSQPALMQAMMITLRMNMGLKEVECDCTPDGQPPEIAPSTFYGISSGPFRSNAIDNALDITYGVDVTISVRLSHIPNDRKGRNFFLSQNSAIHALALRVISGTVKNYDILTKANSLIVDRGAGFSVEPLTLVNPPNVVTRAGDWWGCEPDKSAGISMTLNFFGARRIEYLQDLDVTL